ncbi:MAG: hypothetical protein JST49_00270 [Bacteroidetes bacterium]|nr:hypothetical protein [Bacteroidota bacterium]
MEVSTWPFMTSIEMHITDNKLIQDLQEEFNSLFPYLKIEFFSITSKGKENAKILSPLQAVGQSRKKREDGVLLLNSHMTVTAFEKEMSERFGLQVQVFRQSGKMWIETSLTDSWTLERQNAEGYELSGKSA